MIKAILFDLDGTLLNRDESLKIFVDKQYDRLSHLIGHITKDAYITRFIQLDSRGYVWKDKVYRQLVEEFAVTKITWEELLQDYLEEFKYSCVAFDHLLLMLEELKKREVLIGMITNGYGQFQMDNIKALGIESFFQVILISEWEGMKKPDSQIFLRAADKLGVLPSECVFIGDHPENDVQGAMKTGMMGIWKKDIEWTDVQAEYVIDDLMEIPALMDEW
ncbi:putative hydrolase of the HAD superfamily [Psychrobacillus sp. OK028]|uniref:HAD family hydrolase n=1 Tax=Psychrobacillus sp. OK028 TaxID=1884359 RepID=UPI00088A43E3|nr:HAD family hydrolase [Psychrobacillus sp. OK028]SDM88937.1 putative hydrolase of the HAD superfamily [Psychrobacillus sp. OK028]